MAKYEEKNHKEKQTTDKLKLESAYVGKVTKRDHLSPLYHY